MRRLHATMGIRRGTIVLALVAALLGASASVAAADSVTEARSCAWTVEPTYDQENILYPEEQTLYLAALVPVPPGGYVQLSGEMPHGRYFSLQTYTTTLQPITALHDSQIVPDPGSVNVYQPGADRNATNRRYTVRVVNGAQPASGPAPNTLYNTNSSGESGVAIVYRLYLPDKGDFPYGGVPAPSIAVVTGSGQQLSVPPCPDPLPDTSAVSNLLGEINPVSLPTDLLALPQPVWHKYVNAVSSVGITYTSDPLISGSLQQQVTAITDKLPAGFGENIDNKYIYTPLSTEYGNVVELHVKIPTTPQTYDGEATMGTGQLRYWSMCSGNQATMTYGCLVDEQVPVDQDGDATIVVSSPADRPADATTQCGIGWIPWGPLPQTLMIMRNMLPSATFTQSVQDATGTTVAQTLGPYYPQATYYRTAADFAAAHGCPQGVDGTPAAAAGGCPKATGHASGTSLGLLTLGQTRAQARVRFSHSTSRGMRYEDYFCLTPIGIRAGYASPKLLRTLSPGRRGRFRGRVVWASTANPYYSIAGIRPGARLAAATRILALGKAIPVGQNTWYLAPDGKVTAVLKVRDGVVQEIGIADRQLTRTRAAQVTLMRSFA